MLMCLPGCASPTCPTRALASSRRSRRSRTSSSTLVSAFDQTTEQHASVFTHLHMHLVCRCAVIVFHVSSVTGGSPMMQSVEH